MDGFNASGYRCAIATKQLPCQPTARVRSVPSGAPSSLRSGGEVRAIYRSKMRSSARRRSYRHLQFEGYTGFLNARTCVNMHSSCANLLILRNRSPLTPIRCRGTAPNVVIWQRVGPRPISGSVKRRSRSGHPREEHRAIARAWAPSRCSCFPRPGDRRFLDAMLLSRLSSNAKRSSQLIASRLRQPASRHAFRLAFRMPLIV
jgi:hypothetical protein